MHQKQLRFKVPPGINHSLMCFDYCVILKKGFGDLALVRVLIFSSDEVFYFNLFEEFAHSPCLPIPLTDSFSLSPPILLAYWPV